MGDELAIKVTQTSFHRNGIGGVGFYAVSFTAKVNTDGKDREQKMVAVVFDEPGCCAVLAVEPLTDARGVRFGVNSWRGDNFEDRLREAIKEGDARTGSARV